MLGKLRKLLAFNKALTQYEEIKKEIDGMDAKHLLTSKTFWVNILGLTATIAGILPQKWAVPVMSIANIGMRLVTNQPVTLGFFK